MDQLRAVELYLNDAGKERKDVMVTLLNLANFCDTAAELLVWIESRNDMDEYENQCLSSYHAQSPIRRLKKIAECVPSSGARYMTDAEALNWICTEFGFDRSKVTILHEIDAQEITRHNHCRASGRKIDRRPIYCATDYHYIRFNVGRGEWQWEAWNGHIRPFWD